MLVYISSTCHNQRNCAVFFTCLYHNEASEQALNDYFPEMSYYLHKPQFQESGYKVTVFGPTLQILF